MRETVEYLLGQAREADIAEHLLRCDANFFPPLSERVDIGAYAKKIESQAIRFEAWSDRWLVGLVAAYCNDDENAIAYITNVSVLPEWTGMGIAARLMGQCIENAKALGMRQIHLEVAQDNTPAICLYAKSGFVARRTNVATLFVAMDQFLVSGENHDQKT